MFASATAIFIVFLVVCLKLFPSDKLTRVSSTHSTNNQTTYFSEQTRLIQKIPTTGSDISTEQAYASIPFSSTHFKRQNLNESTIKEFHREYLRSYLQLVNKALVQRIQTLAYFESQGHNGRNFEYYEGRIHTILGEFEGLKVPPEFRKVQTLTTLAINKQLNYFHELNNFKKNNLTIPHIPYGQNGQLHSLVVDSDKLLKMAYSELLVLYPQNESVFKDHLCALDFV